jgi:hypothetical protein
MHPAAIARRIPKTNAISYLSRPVAPRSVQISMKTAKLAAHQRTRLAEVKEAIEAEDLILDIDGLHPLLDSLVGGVECPFEGWRTTDITSISVFVFDRAPRLKFTAESIAADYALRRDTSYGL